MKINKQNLINALLNNGFPEDSSTGPTINNLILILNNISDIDFLSNLTVLSKNELLSVLFILQKLGTKTKREEFITRFKNSKLERKTFLIRELIKGTT